MKNKTVKASAGLVTKCLLAAMAFLLSTSAFSQSALTVNKLTVKDSLKFKGVTIQAIDANMHANSDKRLATQKASKAYADSLAIRTKFYADSLAARQQRKLIAGTNIIIDGDTIKATGTGNGSGAGTVDGSIISGSPNAVAGGAVYSAVVQKVDKVPGKELSENDYTTPEKQKLAGIDTFGYATRLKLYGAIDSMNAGLVHKSLEETITGAKTFEAQVVVGNSLVPKAYNTGTLGSSGKIFNRLFVNDADVYSTLQVSGNLGIGNRVFLSANVNNRIMFAGANAKLDLIAFDYATDSYPGIRPIGGIGSMPGIEIRTGTGNAGGFLKAANVIATGINSGSYFNVTNELATIATPAAGSGLIYGKTDGKLWYKNSAGIDYDLTATGSNVPTNISAFVNDANYLNPTAANLLYAPINHAHSFASLSGRPSTIQGYGITTPLVSSITKNAAGDSIVWYAVDGSRFAILDRSGGAGGTNIVSSPGNVIVNVNGTVRGTDSMMFNEATGTLQVPELATNSAAVNHGNYFYDLAIQQDLPLSDSGVLVANFRTVKRWVNSKLAGIGASTGNADLMYLTGAQTVLGPKTFNGISTLNAPLYFGSHNTIDIGTRAAMLRNIYVGNNVITQGLYLEGLAGATERMLTVGVGGEVNVKPIPTGGTADSSVYATRARAQDMDNILAATLNNSLATKAPVNNPTFTGVQTGTTAPTGTNSTRLATTAFVVNSLDGQTTEQTFTTGTSWQIAPSTAATIVVYLELASPVTEGVLVFPASMQPKQEIEVHFGNAVSTLFYDGTGFTVREPSHPVSIAPNEVLKFRYKAGNSTINRH